MIHSQIESKNVEFQNKGQILLDILDDLVNEYKVKKKFKTLNQILIGNYLFMCTNFSISHQKFCGFLSAVENTMFVYKQMESNKRQHHSYDLPV